MSDWWNQPTKPAVEPASTVDPPAACPWCGLPATADADDCPGCGAVMAQREDLGGLAIPGVTTVDPAMQPRPYTSSVLGAQSRMSTISMVGAVGGTKAQVVLAAALLVKDGIGGTGASARPEEVGKPSQAALEMAQRLRQPVRPAVPPDPVDPSAAQSEGPVSQTEDPGSGRPEH